MSKLSSSTIDQQQSIYNDYITATSYNNNIIHIIIDYISSTWLYEQLSFLDNILSSNNIDNNINQLIKILLLIIILLFIIYQLVSLVYNIRKQNLTSGSRILIIGPQNSGKTLLFHVLQSNTTPITVTSQQSNIAKFMPLQTNDLYDSISIVNTYEYIDIPGHPTYVNDIFNYIESNTLRSILYVISTEYNHSNDHIIYIANQLKTILTNQYLLRHKVPFLLVINTHNNSSVTADTLISQIEKQIDKIRFLDNTLSDISSYNDKNNKQQQMKQIVLGKQDKSFRFEDSQVPVIIRTVNVKEKRIQPILRFLSFI